MSGESVTRPLAVRTVVLDAKFEVQKFDGMKNFGMWQCKVKDVWIQQEVFFFFWIGIQQELDIALEGKLQQFLDKKKGEDQQISLRLLGTICLCLTKNQKYFVMGDQV